MSTPAPAFQNQPAPQLAQFNYADALYEPDDPRMAGFTNNLLRINELADRAPGFVWRLKTDAGHSIDVRPWPQQPLRLVTLSVWNDIDSFRAFSYSGDHARIMSRRHEWFARPTEPFLVMWWIRAGHIPTVDEGKARLAHLVEHGPTPAAFNFKRVFEHDGAPFASAAAPTSPK